MQRPETDGFGYAWTPYRIEHRPTYGPHSRDEPKRTRVSYPDGDQAEDGTIFITYDFERTEAREILMAAFREEDILTARREAPSVRLRQVISRPPDGPSSQKMEASTYDPFKFISRPPAPPSSQTADSSAKD